MKKEKLISLRILNKLEDIIKFSFDKKNKWLNIESICFDNGFEDLLLITHTKYYNYKNRFVMVLYDGSEIVIQDFKTLNEMFDEYASINYLESAFLTIKFFHNKEELINPFTSLTVEE